MTDRAYIVRVRESRHASGYRATVQDMGRGGHVPAHGTAANPLAAIIAAFVQAKLGPPIALDVSDGPERSA